jgi:hypothetical protein
MIRQVTGFVAVMAMALLLALAGCGSGRSGGSGGTGGTGSASPPATTLHAPTGHHRQGLRPRQLPRPDQHRQPVDATAGGTQLVYVGYINDPDGRVEHRVVFTVTDLTKTIDGVPTVVVLDRDDNAGQLTEAELAFQAQDDNGTVWSFGEYPEEWEEGKFTGTQEKEKETLSLVKATHLDRSALAEIHQQALALDKRAYTASRKLYRHTPPAS